MTLEELIDEHPLFAQLSSVELTDYINASYDYVKRMISMKPVVFSLIPDPDKEFFSLNISNTPLNYNETIQFSIKELIDVVSNKELHSLPSETPITPVGEMYFIPAEVIEPTGECYWNGDTIYFKGRVNIIAYPYPNLIEDSIVIDYNAHKSKSINTTLAMPVVAYMYKMFFDRQFSESTSTLYDDITKRYCNLINLNKTDTLWSSNTKLLARDGEATGVKAYDL